MSEYKGDMRKIHKYPPGTVFILSMNAVCIKLTEDSFAYYSKFDRKFAIIKFSVYSDYTLKKGPR